MQSDPSFKRNLLFGKQVPKRFYLCPFTDKVFQDVGHDSEMTYQSEIAQVGGRIQEILKKYDPNAVALMYYE